MRISMGMFAKSVLVSFSLLLLVGCGSIEIGGKKNVVSLFNLTPKSTFAKDLPHVNWTLVVDKPVAMGGLDSKRIALHPTPTEQKYFADAQWTARAPQMIQTLLIESFTNSNRIAIVGRDKVSLRPDYVLKSELREFQAEYHHGMPEPMVSVRLNLLLVDQATRQVVASKDFHASVKSPGTDMKSIILGFDMALGKVMRKTVEWALTLR